MALRLETWDLETRSFSGVPIGTIFALLQAVATTLYLKINQEPNENCVSLDKEHTIRRNMYGSCRVVKYPPHDDILIE